MYLLIYLLTINRINQTNKTGQGVIPYLPNSILLIPILLNLTLPKFVLRMSICHIQFNRIPFPDLPTKCNFQVCDMMHLLAKPNHPHQGQSQSQGYKVLELLKCFVSLAQVEHRGRNLSQGQSPR